MDLIIEIIQSKITTTANQFQGNIGFSQCKNDAHDKLSLVCILCFCLRIRKTFEGNLSTVIFIQAVLFIHTPIARRSHLTRTFVLDGELGSLNLHSCITPLSATAYLLI